MVIHDRNRRTATKRSHRRSAGQTAIGAILLLLVACQPDRPPVPPPPMPAAVPSSARIAEPQPAFSEVPLLPGVPRFQSAQLPPPTVYTPGPTAPTIPYVPPLGSSPVTGFGVGGMQQPPGAPPNPPYPPGGLLH